MTEPVGQQLRQAREARTQTLEQVAKATHLRAHYLRALEMDDFTSIPSAAQARGFVRLYAGYLGLSPEPFLDALNGSQAVETPSQPPESPPTPRGASEISSQAAQAIFHEIGQKLQQQRGLLGLSLEDVEKYTHLRSHYLQALEMGDVQGLPSPVQGRGMLSNYAEFLGMDPEPLLLRMAEALQSQLAARQAERPAPPRQGAERRASRLPAPLRRFLSPEMLLGAVSILALSVFIVWGLARVYALRSEQQPTLTAPSIANVLLAAPSETVTPSPPPPTPTLQALLPAVEEPAGTGTPEAGLATPDANLVQVYVTIRQRAWMRVSVDGKVEFEGRVAPGTAFQYVGEDSVEILTGNAAALQIFFNQQDLGPLGLFGQVVSRQYTRQGVLVPTPTITFTPSITPRPSATPAP
jgi:cytoskeleton protein RodZ